MPSLLNTSLSGMLAFQRALDVTGHNIANANTPGYTRQVAEFASRAGQGTGNGYIGAGTKISTVTRIYDAMLVSQLRTSLTGQSRFDTLNSLSGRIDSLLADGDTGLNTGLQSFFNTTQDLANDPASIPTRQALLGEATGQASRFRALDQRLGELESEVNERMKIAVDDVNQLAGAIADANQKIGVASGFGQPPNDLLDHRDRLILQLSEIVSVTTIGQNDGSVNVYVGSGQSLVTGIDARELSVRGSEFDPTRLSVVYEGASGSTPLDTSLSGGSLGGLLEFRTRVLDPSRQSLGQTAAAFVMQINAQHAAGMDLRGNLGGDMFAIAPPTVLASNSNSGSGTAVAEVNDLGALTGADYILEFDGAAYSLSRADTGQPIALSGSGTVADPFRADGLSIEVGGAAAAGDRMLVRSSNDAAGSVESLISDPQAIALASPVRVQASINNIGNASISAMSVYDTSDPGLLVTAVIEMTSPVTYSINGAGSFPYSAGTPIAINGTSVTLEGEPLTGDQFTISANSGASGDNSNGLKLAEIQSVGALDGGTISINENYGRLVASVGGTTRQIQAGLAAQDVVLANAEGAVLSTSAVNLDEEAAKLIQYQQAYQAVAQIVSITSTLFDSLLNATRR